ncbi:hypothetical protein SAMN04487936_104339 [Halobacillus dabanensis]|uniref:Death on curing protein n=1 Tax=Halobacillus dabanensis TaxID=240302 RepID=A0A1I3UGG1_HALDA|nr:hypothetical protein [Halobacillus dabanensis]SFJ82598.1 hypothetical protein SAMN04487936_104339 [Halobacillus dabanensis]
MCFYTKFVDFKDLKKTKLFGEEQFPSVIKILLLLYSIARNGYIFHNGNNRIALAVIEIYLNLNGNELTFKNEEAEDDKFKENDCIQYLTDELFPYVIKLEEDI